MNPYKFAPADEQNHTPSGDQNFNESVYTNGFDTTMGLGGWMRLGKRANEGYAELQTCFYLPDGRIACQFKRPDIENNDCFAVAGMKYEVIKTGESVRMSYQGPFMLVDDPNLLRDPRAFFTSAPVVDGAVEWVLDAVSPVHGGEPVDDDQVTWYPRDFSRAHFFQHMRAAGTVSIGDESFVLSGFGWRDHSWGPRYWTNIHYYRLFISTFGADRGFTILKITDRDGITRRNGVLLVDGRFEDILDLDLITDWTAMKDPSSIMLGIRTANRAVKIRGQIRTLAPLSNRRKVGDEVLRTRIAEGLTEWEWDGVKGLGITEYIERVDDDGPAGYPL
jgi:hypothetical protein